MKVKVLRPFDFGLRRINPGEVLTESPTGSLGRFLLQLRGATPPYWEDFEKKEDVKEAKAVDKTVDKKGEK
jgi:nitrogen regulatory protein PII-like uncharacterized protein